MNFGAYVTAALFDGQGRLAFALGDGTVRLEGGQSVRAHGDGAILCAAIHPSGVGVLTGGDDGRVVWTRDGAAEPVAEVKDRWIDALAVSPESHLIAFAAGKELHIRDAADAAFRRVFDHDRSLAALAFDPKGKRVAAATYGGAVLWYARIAEQRPALLRFAGSHVGLVWSPEGKYLISAMQENQLHGWRIADGVDMSMGGYPTKIKSMAFLSNGLLLATSGAQGVVVWPFTGPRGPMGQQAAEIGYDPSTIVVRVAATPQAHMVAAGLQDGRVWMTDVRANKITRVRQDAGPPITALALSPDGSRLAWGDEAGGAGVVQTAQLQA